MNPTVAGALIGVGGTVIVALAGLWANVRNTSATTALSSKAVEAAQRTVELTEQGQVTDRYTKAIEQLGSDKLDVRIGGIYALERIAHDSPRDHPTAMEVLAAFVREHSREQWPKPEPHAESSGTQPRRMTRPDVQAAITVIGRRNSTHDSGALDLSNAYLRLAKLTYADLSGASFYGADLSNADLSDSKLTGAVIGPAIFRDAILSGTDLRGAYLRGTDLRGAYLFGAKLANADLAEGADLTGAKLKDADFSGVDLTETKLSGVDFSGVDLTHARWPLDVTVPDGWQRDPASGRLKRADTNSGTSGK
jgi:hypothetical protein